jgi:hypothetical protein
LHIFRDTESIRAAPEAAPGLCEHLRQRLNDLSEYGDELSSLVNVVVLEPSDTLDALNAALGFRLEERVADLKEAYTGWHELTYVLGDDGFGLLVYVPDRHEIDPRLRRLCEAAPLQGSP